VDYPDKPVRGVKIGRRSRVNFGRRLTVTDSRFYEYAPFSILRLAYYGGFDDFELPKMIDLRPTPRHLLRKTQPFG